MADISRISEILESLKDLWIGINPEMPFGRLLDDFSRYIYQDSSYGDIYSLEDEEVIEAFSEYLERNKKEIKSTIK